MKLSTTLLLAALTFTLAGCDLIGDILEFSFWTALILIVLVVAVIWWAVSRFRRPPRP